MAGETTTDASQIGTSIPTEIDSELIAEVRETLTMVPLTDFRALAGNNGLTLQFPRLTTTVALTAITSGTAEADAQSATSLVTAVASATAASKAAHVLQSWLSMFGSAVNWEQAVPQILGRAAADLMDVDAAALLGGFSNTVGSTGVNQTLDDLRTAATTLRRVALGAADGGVYMLHPQQLHDVDAELLSGSGTGLSPLLERMDVVNWFGAEPGAGFLRAFRGTLFGIPVMTSSNVPDINAGADHGGALFVPQAAIGGVYAWLPTIIRDRQSVNLKLADSWQVSTAFGFVEKKDEMGVTIVGDHV